MSDYLSKPLTDREAGRVRTLLEQKKGRVLKLRELTGFSPEDIASAHAGLNAGEIARFAGRKDGRDIVKKGDRVAPDKIPS